eukprot:TRINITY_DN32023_c0_g1_i1.p1 TRINITY_DN32023_c0_g1~~TRINITY_DN32023_c0_g1_i1.p1  ORF type:complete len:199 (-),score=2.53 TRINITY_DN32023_c0_g1_i1:69-665(-)
MLIFKLLVKHVLLKVFKILNLKLTMYLKIFQIHIHVMFQWYLVHKRQKTLDNDYIIDWIKRQSEVSKKVFSICTGAALLAKANLLEGIKATTNKQAICYIINNHPECKADWVGHARWVDSGKYLTSSGVSAGTDASLFLIKQLRGIDEVNRILTKTEYTWDSNSDDDPFAKDLSKCQSYFFIEYCQTSKQRKLKLIHQ